MVRAQAFDLGHGGGGVPVPSLPQTSLVALGKSLSISVPWLSCLYHRASGTALSHNSVVGTERVKTEHDQVRQAPWVDGSQTQDIFILLPALPLIH